MGTWLVHNELDRQTHWNGDDTAFVFEDRTYTYGQFGRRVNRVARALREFGIGDGNRVITHAKNHVELYTIFYACSKLGATYSPISTFQSDENIEYICDRLEPAAVFYSSDSDVVDDGLPELRKHVPDGPFVAMDDIQSTEDRLMDELIEGYDGTDPEWANRHDPAIDHNIFWTSGTTGRPKAVIRDHTSTLHFADGFASQLPMSDMDRRLIISNMMYMGPYFRDGITTPRTGGTLYVLREFDPGRVVKAIDEWDINAFQIEFTLANLLIEHLNEQGSNVHVEHLYATLKSAEIAEQLYNICENLYHLYAQTEAGQPFIERLEPPFDDIPTLGSPIESADVRVVPVDSERGTLPREKPHPGDDGVLVVRAEGSLTEYLDDANQREYVHDGWVFTGDIVGINEEGGVFFKGRVDDRIRSGGVNIYPPEVEKVLADHSEVEDVVVVGAEDETWGERICALVVSTGDCTTDELTDELNDYCIDHESLSREMRPREYSVVTSSEEIPTGALDKVDREKVVSEHFE